MKIDIGCGRNKRPGWIGLDSEDFGQEYVRDLTKGLPFADNTVNEVDLSHSIEHFRTGEELFFLLHEIYRVCPNRAKVHIRVPHAGEPEAFDPAHVSHWNENALRYLDRREGGLAIPRKYSWDYRMTKIEKNGSELHVEAEVYKPEVLPAATGAKVCIITVAWNQLDHTKRFVQSVRRFTRDIRYQIVVLNNASTDGTKEWLDAQADILAIEADENVGWINGVNEAITYFRAVYDDADFYVIANNDTVVTDSGWLQRLLNHFTETTGAVGPTSNYVIGRQSSAYNHPGIYEEETNTLIGFFFVIRREILDVVGLLDPAFGMGGADDHDYSIRIRQAGYTLKIARDVFVHHSGSKTFMQILGPEGYEAHWKEMDKRLEEKWGKEEVNKLFAPPLHVVAGIPMRTDYLHRLFALRFAGIVKPYYWTTIDAPRGLIHDSRNEIVREALKIGAHYVLFLDDDMVPPPDLFLRLFSHNVPVVSALAFKRRVPYDPCIFQFGTDPKAGELGALPLHGLVRRGLRKVDATGFGAVLISTEIFKKIPDPWFELGKFGEDLDFCVKCFDHDIPVFCDTDLIIQHIGDPELVDETSYNRARAEGQHGSKIVEIHGKEKVEKVLV